MAGLDQIDRKILRELASEGRISNIELADRVGLSPSACLRRVQELERSGVIKGYRAVVDPAKLGLNASPTRVVKIFSPAAKTGGVKLQGEEPAEMARKLVEMLKERKLI